LKRQLAALLVLTCAFMPGFALAGNEAAEQETIQRLVNEIFSMNYN